MLSTRVFGGCFYKINAVQYCYYNIVEISFQCKIKFPQGIKGILVYSVRLFECTLIRSMAVECIA